MKNILFFTLGVLAVLAVSCTKEKEEAVSSKISVVATTSMITDAASVIAGDRASVIGLMGPGVDPHLYKATAGDVRRLQSADVILYNGIYLEARMGEVIEQMERDTPVYAVAERIPETNLLVDPVYENSFDPHVWFDVSLWQLAVSAIYDALVEVDPEGADVYEKNYLQYKKELDILQDEVKKRLSRIHEDQRVLITAHDAFEYFGRAYGFEVRGLQGVNTVNEAGAKDIKTLADFITNRKIPAIFIESSVPRKNIDALQAAVKDRGFNVIIGGELFSDATGEAGTIEGTYLGMVRHNIDTIVNAFTRNTQE